MLSAKTESALNAATSNLAHHLASHPEVDLADVAYTLQVGRKAFPILRAIACETAADAVRLLEQADPQRVVSGVVPENRAPVVFMFPGQGAQHAQMGRELYDAEESFRSDVDRCAEFLLRNEGFDLRHALYADTNGSDLSQTSLAQPALFVIEYALAKLWMRWGVQPSAMIGHSIGEYTAACLAGVFSLEDALRLVGLRGQLMQSLPAGAMLAIPLDAREVQSLLSEGLSLAAVNGPANCTVSGSLDAISDLEQVLQRREVSYRRLHTSHAFHSEMVEPVLDQFAEQLGRVALAPLQIPYLSNVSGNWITVEEATSVDYWTTHLRRTVRFSEGLSQLTNCTLLEVGPGQTLTTLARQNERTALASMRAPRQEQSDLSVLLLALGRLWLAGVDVDWSGFYGDEKRRRVSLPTYPFERQLYWIEPEAAPEKDKQFYSPSWRQTPLLPRQPHAEQSGTWLLFGDGADRLTDLAERLKQDGRDVQTVCCDPNEGFYELLQLAQSLGKHDLAAPVRLFVLSDNLHAVNGSESLSPHKGLVQPLCKIIPQEYPGIACRHIDLAEGVLIDHVYRELIAGVSDSVVAYRGRQRWVKTFAPLHAPVGKNALREGGVYLITGGLGRIGLSLAQYLAESINAKLILVGRSAPPNKRPWAEWSAGNVTYVQADAANMDQMRAVFESAGELHGVVHAAGLVGSEWLRPVAQTDREFCEAHFRPKIQGALVLQELLREREIDFCILLSSLSTILGGLGYAAYAAANAFLDTLAQQLIDSRTPWLSLNLDGWTNDADGMQAFQRALELVGTAPQIVVSNGDLAARINRAERLEDQEAASRRRNLASERVKQSDNGHVAPASDLERDIVRIWAEAFGFESIGVDENFFELGGDSLLATQINARLKRSLQIDLSLETFFAFPTIAGLASAILQTQSDQDESAKSELLKLLEALSEDEIEAELLKRTPQVLPQ
jgi:acyl transferase domain-containing protein/acyl carrier protein